MRRFSRCLGRHLTPLAPRLSQPHARSGLRSSGSVAGEGAEEDRRVGVPRFRAAGWRGASYYPRSMRDKNVLAAHVGLATPVTTRVAVIH
jgi:hypothetical protein